VNVSDETFEIHADAAQWCSWLKCNLCGHLDPLGPQISLNGLFERVLAHSFNCPVNVAVATARTAIVTSLVMDNAEGVVKILDDFSGRISTIVGSVLGDAPDAPADDVCNACGAYVKGGNDPAIMSQHDCEGEEG